MLRSDISEAVDATPPHIRAELVGPCAEALDLLNAHLPADESVTNIISASPNVDGEVNSLIVITDRRLLLVLPAPQVVSWRLSSLTRIQVFGGYFFLEGDAGNYSPGLVRNEWSSEFEGQVKRASAIALL